ncbi:hypothetical protein ACFL5U_03300 [Candidatus Margulisiibacteriota bacterium]
MIVIGSENPGFRVGGGQVGGADSLDEQGVGEKGWEKKPATIMGPEGTEFMLARADAEAVQARADCARTCMQDELAPENYQETFPTHFNPMRFIDEADRLSIQKSYATRVEERLASIATLMNSDIAEERMEGLRLTQWLEQKISGVMYRGDTPKELKADIKEKLRACEIDILVAALSDEDKGIQDTAAEFLKQKTDGRVLRLNPDDMNGPDLFNLSIDFIAGKAEIILAKYLDKTTDASAKENLGKVLMKVKTAQRMLRRDSNPYSQTAIAAWDVANASTTGAEHQYQSIRALPAYAASKEISKEMKSTIVDVLFTNLQAKKHGSPDYGIREEAAKALVPYAALGNDASAKAIGGLVSNLREQFGSSRERAANLLVQAAQTSQSANTRYNVAATFLRGIETRNKEDKTGRGYNAQQQDIKALTTLIQQNVLTDRQKVQAKAHLQTAKAKAERFLDAAQESWQKSPHQKTLALVAEAEAAL